MPVPMSGNRKSAQTKNPYIRPAPRCRADHCPQNSHSQVVFCLGLRFRLQQLRLSSERICVMGRGAEGNGCSPAVAAIGAGAAWLMRSPPAGAAAAIGGGGGDATAGLHGDWPRESAALDPENAAQERRWPFAFHPGRTRDKKPRLASDRQPAPRQIRTSDHSCRRL
jgi:hypothetical protein